MKPSVQNIDSAPAKDRIEFRLVESVTEGGNSSDAHWNAIDGEMEGYQKQFGVTPQTTRNVVLCVNRSSRS